MAGTYKKFLDALGMRESSGNYRAVNQYGYLGKYQMGEAALIDTGYYTSDGTSKNDWQPSHFTGKGGIDSKSEFLNSPQAQEAAIRTYMEKQWQYISSVWKYEGQVLGGVHITISGMLGGAHLVGQGGLKAYLNSGGDTARSDANGTAVQSYIKQFAGYATPFTVNHNAAETIKGGSLGDRLFGRGGADTLSGGGGKDRLDGGPGHDILSGGAGKDRLDGGPGHDILSGGAGADQFLFRSLSGAGDTIRDFKGDVHGKGDHLVIDTRVFGGDAGDTVKIVHTFPMAKNKETVLYDRNDGSVFYDPDGTGPHKTVLIAVLDNHPALHAADILLI